MIFCTNCGRALDDGTNFCPLCGTAVAVGADADTTASAATDPIPVTQTVPVYDPASAADYRVILFSRGTCSAANARALLRDILGYSASEARNILNIVPVEIACNMNMAQAMYLAQALTEYGMEISVCNSQGYVNVPNAATSSVYDRTGSFLPAVASALAMLSAANRVREFRRLTYRARPSLFQLAFRPAPPPRSARRYSSFGIFHPAPRPAPRPVSPRPTPPAASHWNAPRPSGSGRPGGSNIFGGNSRPSGSSAGKPAGGAFGSRPGGSSSRPSGSRPSDGSSRPSGGSRPSGFSKPSGGGRSGGPGGRGNQRF